MKNILLIAVAAVATVCLGGCVTTWDSDPNFSIRTYSDFYPYWTGSTFVYLDPDDYYYRGTNGSIYWRRRINNDYFDVTVNVVPSGRFLVEHYIDINRNWRQRPPLVPQRHRPPHGLFPPRGYDRERQWRGPADNHGQHRDRRPPMINQGDHGRRDFQSPPSIRRENISPLRQPPQHQIRWPQVDVRPAPILRHDRPQVDVRPLPTPRQFQRNVSPQRSVPSPSMRRQSMPSVRPMAPSIQRSPSRSSSPMRSAPMMRQAPSRSSSQMRSAPMMHRGSSNRSVAPRSSTPRHRR